MNAASEPHVQEFCQFLAMIGVAIEGIGTSRLCVTGGRKLGGGEFRFAEDFHEIATFARARRDHRRRHHGAQLVARTFPADRPHVREVRRQRHAPRRLVARGARRPLRVRRPFTQNILTKVEAAPWPYLPVDLLPIFIALGVRAEGSAMFWNKVYDGALGWSGELSKFGAHVLLSDPHRLITFGGLQLTPARVEPVHHPCRDRAADGGREHRRPFGNHERAADPPRTPALRREPALGRRERRVDEQRVKPLTVRRKRCEQPYHPPHPAGACAAPSCVTRLLRNRHRRRPCGRTRKASRPSCRARLLGRFARLSSSGDDGYWTLVSIRLPGSERNSASVSLLPSARGSPNALRTSASFHVPFSVTVTICSLPCSQSRSTFVASGCTLAASRSGNARLVVGLRVLARVAGVPVLLQRAIEALVTVAEGRFDVTAECR